MSDLLENFVKGQRIINESDPQMGLGCVEEVVDERLLKVFFPAKSEECLYRIKTAPLRRIILHVGQMAVARDGRHFRIEKITQDGGLITYWNGDQSMSEAELEDKVPLSSSLGRMHYGNVGYPEDLHLRLSAHKLRSKMLSSEAYFIGASRASLLPHQLYVTERVCSMLNPRVLLSDEVGLGKTIEAGRIFSVLRECGRASRVLIVLPDSLTNQWLAEMARRFNEVFSLVGSEALEDDEPYMAARRAITPWTALKDGLLDEALKYDWDLLIVDEAHHLHEGQEAYEAVSQLAEHSRSVLLLTATPSRSGLETEFGLLRLVDPKRFTDFDTYCQERETWKHGSDLAKELHLALSEDKPGSDHKAVVLALKNIEAEFASDEQIKHLSRALQEHLDTDSSAEHSRALLSALIDRHGPGRVLFRNRRARLSGLFSGRVVHPVPLSRNGAENIFPGLGELTPAQLRQDQRVLWIASYIKSHPGEKIVLIAKRMQLVAALHERLRDNFGIYSAVFHEGLTVFERDKQAVWFTDPEGADILLCSEIGSEGRNFQAAHTLIFWDIPLSPDTVEQRIGRLDRIGQTHPVDVYVMYFKGGTPEERLFAWHKIMGSFEGPVEGGEEIAATVHLDQVLMQPGDFRPVLVQSLELAKKYKQIAEDNVDYLVDLNSFNEERGQELAATIEAETKNFDVEGVVTKLLDRFGVNVEELSTAGMYHLTPGKNMQIDALSRLHEGGMLATFNRELALAREEVEYLNGAHPLVKELLSFALDGTDGSASAVYWKSAPKSGLVVQFLFIFEAIGQDNLELGRYLSPVPILINVNLDGTIYREEIPAHKGLKRIKPNSVVKLWEKCGERVELLTEKVVKAIQNMVKPMRTKAMEKAKLILEGEKLRLQELTKINPSVTQDDVETQEELNEVVYSAIADSSPRLDAIRLVLMEPGEND